MSGAPTRRAGAVRATTTLTGGWRFAPHHEPGRPLPNDATSVTVPHTVVELPWHGFDDAEYQMRSSYERTLELGEAQRGGHDTDRLFLRFDAVMTAAEVSLDGRALARHEGGYLPFEVELTDHLDGGDRAVLRVDVDSHHLPHVPPFGGRIGFMTFGGIYREVHLERRPAVHIADTVIRSHPSDGTVSHAGSQERAVDDPAAPARDVEVTIHLDGADPPDAAAASRASPRPSRVAVSIDDGDVTLARTVHGFDGPSVTVELPGVEGLVRWDVDRPRRYDVVVALLADDGSVLDERRTRTGFRDAAFTPAGFVLNGRRLQLRGLNRHQSYPYVGVAMPARMQRRDAEILRTDLACNVVRSSHYPPSPHFLDACDELGLLVITEIPGWQHLGEGHWKDLVLRDVRDMIVRDRHHPSVILWGTRINESQDDHELYSATAALARELDPTRQTGGVRYFATSELLEDVYTYNDFHWPMLDPVAPLQFNSEFVGHTFPTRQGDPSDRHVEHALRHARTHDHLASQPGYSGGTGWAAFDYNQGPEINAADRVDAHGVGDIFRHPKPAAAFYASQVEPAERIVLELVGSWARGDAAEPSARDDPWETERLVCSNCDRVEVYLDDALHDTVRADRATFPHLRFPPSRVVLPSDRHRPDVLTLVGYVADQPVVVRRYAGDGVDRELRVWLDHEELLADGNDLTQLSFAVTDVYGNRRRSASGVIHVTATGPLSIVGENPFGLVAGGGALYLRAGTQPGRATITVAHPRLGTREVTLTVRG